MLAAYKKEVSSRIHRPKSKDEALQYLIDSGEGALAKRAVANEIEDDEIIEMAYEIMQEHAEEDEAADDEESNDGDTPPDDDSRPITHEEVFGEPEEEDDPDSWEKIFGEPRPESEESEGYADDDYDFREQLKGQKIAFRIAQYRQRAEELASTPSSPMHQMHVLDFLNGIHAGTDRGPEDIRHVHEMAKGLGLANPPQNMRELLVALGQHIHQQSRGADTVNRLHKHAEELSQQTDSGQSRWQIHNFVKDHVPKEYIHALARKMGVDPHEDHKQTRYRIASHIHGKMLGNAANTPTVSQMPQETPANAPSPSQMPTIKK